MVSPPRIGRRNSDRSVAASVRGGADSSPSARGLEARVPRIRNDNRCGGGWFPLTPHPLTPPGQKTKENTTRFCPPFFATPAPRLAQNSKILSRPLPHHLS